LYIKQVQKKKNTKKERWKKFFLPYHRSLIVDIVDDCVDDLNLTLLAYAGHSAVGAGVGLTMADGLDIQLLIL